MGCFPNILLFKHNFLPVLRVSADAGPTRPKPQQSSPGRRKPADRGGMRARCLLVASVCLCCLICACSSEERKEPVSLTMWHVYGSMADSPMNRLIEKFNATEGRARGIAVTVRSISNSTAIHFPLVAAARDEPGSGNLPDLFITYPKTVLCIDPEKLLDWEKNFSAAEIQDYVPSFLQEGQVNEKQLLFPVVKSTSMLFVNSTIFDAFARDTGISYADLDTWEGMFKAAAAYYTWSGGKAFFKYDDWLHYSMINTVSFGGSLFADGSVNFADKHFQNIWKKLAKAAIMGHVCLLDGYSTTAMMTGETVCGVESSASIIYFKDTVTFPDNTRQPLRLKILPVPCFRDARRVAIQRGAGMVASVSDAAKAEACALFVKWLTDPEQNVPFAVATGYLPVKKDALEKYKNSRALPEMTEREQALYSVMKDISPRYEFYTPPYFAGYGELEKKFCATQNAIFKKYRARADGGESDAMTQKMFDEFARIMQ